MSSGPIVNRGNLCHHHHNDSELRVENGALEGSDMRVDGEQGEAHVNRAQRGETCNLFFFCPPTKSINMSTSSLFQHCMCRLSNPRRTLVAPYLRLDLHVTPTSLRSTTPQHVQSQHHRSTYNYNTSLYIKSGQRDVGEQSLPRIRHEARQSPRP